MNGVVVTGERLDGDFGEEMATSDDDDAVVPAIEDNRGRWVGDEGCDAALSDDSGFGAAEVV